VSEYFSFNEGSAHKGKTTAYKMANVPEEHRFAANVNVLATAVRSATDRLHKEGYSVPDPQTVALAAGLISKFEPHRLIQMFIKSSNGTWDSIHSRNEKFFIEHSTQIFSFLPMDKVSMFRDIFTLKDSRGHMLVDQDARNDIWELLHAMIKICIKYIHKHRVPTNRGYSRPDYFGDIDLSHHAKLWKVHLQ
jgi:hypothetical protein